MGNSEFWELEYDYGLILEIINERVTYLNYLRKNRNVGFVKTINSYW